MKMNFIIIAVLATLAVVNCEVHSSEIQSKHYNVFTVTAPPQYCAVNTQATQVRNADGTWSLVTNVGCNAYGQPVYRVQNLNTGGVTMVSQQVAGGQMYTSVVVQGSMTTYNQYPVGGAPSNYYYSTTSTSGATGVYYPTGTTTGVYYPGTSTTYYPTTTNTQGVYYPATQQQVYPQYPYPAPTGQPGTVYPAPAPGTVYPAPAPVYPAPAPVYPAPAPVYPAPAPVYPAPVPAPVYPAPVPAPVYPVPVPAPAIVYPAPVPATGTNQIAATCPNSGVDQNTLFTNVSPINQTTNPQPVYQVTNSNGQVVNRQLVGYNCFGEPIYQDTWTNANGTTSSQLVSSADNNTYPAYQNASGTYFYPNTATAPVGK